MSTPMNSEVPVTPKASAEELPRFPPVKAITQIMAEQGVTGPQDLDALARAGADLWESDAEFEQFQEWLRESRREGR